MIRIITRLIILSSLTSCSVKTEHNSRTNTPLTVNQNDTSNFVILPVDSLTLVDNASEATSLTEAELILIDTILTRHIDRYNQLQQRFYDSLSKKYPEYNLKSEDYVIDLRRYKRQYFPIITSNGVKKVRVNCFCDEQQDWRTNEVVVQDGGNCFFNLSINLNEKTVEIFMVNADA